jgi:beta-glucosidase
MSTISFPESFRWGTATSSYQIEGAAAIDGRTPSIWDTFCQVPGAVANGEDGRTAVDHYHRYREDVAQLSELGLDTYRFSVSWSRVLRADGSVNPLGMDFYSRLTDELLGAGIEPWLTLYHWDLPEFLPGGWLNRDTANKFADYAVAMQKALGDRVRIWTTLNEPWCASFLSYGAGEHAPGHTDPTEAVRSAHHLMLAHGLATQALRAADQDAQLGITLNFTPVSPADPTSAADVDLARRIDGTANRFFLEAIFKGAYPADVIDDLGSWWEPGLVRDGDLAAIAAPIELLGVNYYTTDVVRAPGPEEVAAPKVVRGRQLASPHITAPQARSLPRDLPVTAMGWPVDPAGLHWLLTWLHRDYTGPAGVGLVITENGAAYGDEVLDSAGQILDLDRIEYLRGHIAACGQAIAEGVDLRGYLVWSLVDNFEWAHGYQQRFGILAVDSELRRLPKASASWFKELVQAGVLQL